MWLVICSFLLPPPSLTHSLSALVESDFVLGVDCDSTALEQAQSNVQELELEDCISLIQASVGRRGRDNGCSSNRRNSSSTALERKTKGGGGRKGNRGRGGGRGRQHQSGRSTQRPASTDAIQEDAADDDDDDDWIFPLLDNCVDTVVTNPPFGTKPDKAGMDMQFLKLGCKLARRAVYSFHKSSTRDYVLRTVRALPHVRDAAVVAEMKFDLPRTYKFHKAASVDVEVDLIRVELVVDVDDDDDDESDSKNSEKRASDERVMEGDSYDYDEGTNSAT